MFDHMGWLIAWKRFAPSVPEICSISKDIDLPAEQMPTLDFRRLRNTRYNYYGKVNQNDLDQILRDGLAANHSVFPEFDTECVAVKQEGE